MNRRVSTSHARMNLNALLDEVCDDRDVVIIRRRGGVDVALIAVDELEGLLTTVHRAVRELTETVD